MNHRIVIIQYFLNNINGNIFYLEELAQHLEDIYNLDVYVLNLNKNQFDRKKLLVRYNSIVKETETILYGDIVISTVHALKYIINNIDKIYKVFIMNSANAYKIFINYNITNNNIFKSKIYLLHEYPFTNKMEKIGIFKKVLSIKRGFYFDRYIKSSKSNNKFLIYSNKFDYKIYNYDSMISGLLYIRFKDFMPRLPYEFWYENKPVVFFDISDGIKIKCTNIMKYDIIIKDVSVYKIDMKELYNELL